MTRQLLFIFAAAICSTYGLQGAAQDLGDEGGGTSIDVVEHIPGSDVRDQDDDRRRVFSVRFLCGRVNDLETLLGDDDGIVDRDPGVGVVVGDRDDGVRVGIGIGDGSDRTGGIGGGIGGIGGGIGGIDGIDGIGRGDRRDGLGGFEPLQDGFELTVAPGRYRTVVTVFNPNPRRINPPIQLVPTLPLGFRGPVGVDDTIREPLEPRQGFDIDCSDIVDRFGDSFGFGGGIGFDDRLALLERTFFSGLLVIETADLPLDVSAVYTAKTAD